MPQELHQRLINVALALNMELSSLINVMLTEGLEQWERAWAGAPTGGERQSGPRQFPPSLLLRGDFAFLGGFSHQRVVAGAVVNRSPGAAGLSNFFGVPHQGGSIWPALIRLARGIYPGVPLVGYARGDALRQALAAGFVASGTLRVMYHESN